MRKLRAGNLTVYGIFNGGDRLMGVAYARTTAEKLINKAKAEKAIGFSLHGRGLSGECSFTNVGEYMDIAFPAPKQDIF